MNNAHSVFRRTELVTVDPMESKSEGLANVAPIGPENPRYFMHLTTRPDNVHPEHGLTRPCTTRDLHKSHVNRDLAL